MQSKEELEEWYKTPDPWAYQITEDDAKRKEIILEMLPYNYQRALDIGCGEGFITANLPAADIHGIEISDTAASRFPWNVKRVLEPVGVYDLVITTGTLYHQSSIRNVRIAEPFSVFYWSRPSIITLILFRLF